VLGFENLTGSGFADMLNGTDQANRIDGGAGNDQIVAGDGNDTLIGGLGDDQIDGGAGDDLVMGGIGDNDVLTGGTGNDTLSYVDSASAVTASLADGVATAAGGTDLISGFETLIGSRYADLLTGGASTDRLVGDNGNDQLWGGGGEDLLEGGSGLDKLTGGAGQDRLSGGASGDQFIFAVAGDSAVGAADLILDFSQAEKDKIVFDHMFVGRASFIGDAVFSGHTGELRYDLSGADLIVSGDIDGDGTADFQIQLIGTQAITAGDFLFV
jgi:serralysin